MAGRELEAALEELYATAPAAFTRTRDALAKSFKAGGDPASAEAIKTRRKPTQIAWVLNQLARRHPDDLAELVDVGRELAREQRKALRGEASTSLRESIARQRAAISTLTQKTGALMKELGLDPTGHLDEIASALQAGLVDPAVGAQLEEGRLDKAPETAVGFGGPTPMGPLTPAPAPPPSAPAPRRPAEPTWRSDGKLDARARAEAARRSKKEASARTQAERAAASVKAAAARAAAAREAKAESCPRHWASSSNAL